MSQAQFFSDAVACLHEFYQHIDDAYGLYLDATMAMQTYSTLIAHIQEIASRDNTDIIDNNAFAYGNSNNGAGPFRVQHKSTQGDIKLRNKKGGRNERTMSRSLLITIYQYWEDFYRARFAALCNKSKNDITSDYFGDIRHIRISIIHCGNRAYSDISKCKILTYFKEGDEIFLSNAQVDDLIEKLRSEIANLAMKYAGANMNLPREIYS